MPLPWIGSSLSSALLIVLSVILMVISAFRPSVYIPLRSSVSDFLSPALLVMSLPFQNLSIFFHDVTSLAQLQADNLRLKQENERLREWYHTALLLDSENKSLRDLLNLKVDPDYHHISARVVSDSGNTYVKSLLISLGANDDVSKGAAVLSGEGLIGRVVEVNEKTSRILLVTDINSRVPVVVEDTGQHAIMAGMNESKLRLIHLSQESEISEGARLITSGYGGVYPHGIPVGKVVRLSENSLGVIPFANFDRIQIVRILQMDNPEPSILESEE